MKWTVGIGLFLVLQSGCAESTTKVRRDSPQTLAELATVEVPHQRLGASLPPLPAAAHPVRVSYRLCVDPVSKQTLEVRPIFGDPVADALLVPTLRASTWQVQSPDEVVCFLESLAATADGAWQVLPQPYIIAGPVRDEQPGDAQPQLPLEVQRHLVGKSVVGLFRMCVPKDGGTVTSVSSVVGVPGADEAIAASLKGWRYRGPGAESCWVEPLLFTLNAAPIVTPERDDNKQLSKGPRNSGSMLPSGMTR